MAAREVLNQSADLTAREELFADLNAREVEQVMAYLRAVAEPADEDETSTSPPSNAKVAPTPVKSGSTPTPAEHARVKVAAKDTETLTVTSTMAPTPTPCTAKDLKKAMQHKKVEAARETLKELNEKEEAIGELDVEEKATRKKARKVIRRARHRNVKKAKRIFGKCRNALRKAGIHTLSKCVEDNKDACKIALSKVGVTEGECNAAEVYLKLDKELRAAKETMRVHELSEELAHAKAALEAKIAPIKVGPEGVPTVIVMEGPTCTTDAAASTRTLAPDDAKTKRELFQEMDIFGREYDFEALD